MRCAPAGSLLAAHEPERAGLSERTDPAAGREDAGADAIGRFDGITGLAAGAAEAAAVLGAPQLPLRDASGATDLVDATELAGTGRTGATCRAEAELVGATLAGGAALVGADLTGAADLGATELAAGFAAAGRAVGGGVVPAATSRRATLGAARRCVGLSAGAGARPSAVRRSTPSSCITHSGTWSVDSIESRDELSDSMTPPSKRVGSVAMSRAR